MLEVLLCSYSVLFVQMRISIESTEGIPVYGLQRQKSRKSWINVIKINIVYHFLIDLPTEWFS